MPQDDFPACHPEPLSWALRGLSIPGGGGTREPSVNGGSTGLSKFQHSAKTMPRPLYHWAYGKGAINLGSGHRETSADGARHSRLTEAGAHPARCRFG